MTRANRPPRFSWLSGRILKLLGWTLIADFPDTDKYVLIAAPHTSNWDFPLGILAARALKLDVRWLGKHTLFRRPFGWFFRALGGVPVQRDQALNLIEQISALFARSDRLIVALAPEGTRSKTDHWKSGFYHVARAAGVPIAMACLDHGQKQIVLGGTFYPGDDIEGTFDIVREFYKDHRGKRPENESEIRARTR